MSLRAELRRQKKAAEPKTFNMTKASFDAAVADAVKRERIRMCKHVVHQFSAAVALVARDRLGFGGLRLNRFLSDIMVAFNDMREDRIDADGIAAMIRDETGVELKKY